MDDLASTSDSKEYRPEREDEKPQIVVLQSGDLTAEEVAIEEERLAKGKCINLKNFYVEKSFSIFLYA